MSDCAREARSIKDKRSSRAVVDFGASSETVEGGRDRTLLGDETEDGVRVLACSLLCAWVGSTGWIGAPDKPALRELSETAGCSAGAS